MPQKLVGQMAGQRRSRLNQLVTAQLVPSKLDVHPAGFMLRDVRAYFVREPDAVAQYMIVRLETREGLVGYGEGELISEDVFARGRPLLLNNSFAAYEPMRQALADIPGLQAAANIALLDLLGKRANVPVYQLLGGPTRHKVRALATLQGESDDEVSASLVHAKGLGHRAFHVPLPPAKARNQGQDFVAAVRRRLEVLRRAGGEETDLVLDGNDNLTPGDGLSLAEALQNFHLLWFDEPCPFTNLAAARKISSRTVTPLGFGRNSVRTSDFQNLLSEQMVDVLRPSISKNGITQIRRIAAMAETYYTAVAPHHDGGPIATAAALHLAASLPNFFIQQLPVSARSDVRKFRSDLTGPAIEAVHEGFLSLPQGVGLGLTVNDALLERYQKGAK